ncbi:MAG: hypothetical protein U0T79_02930 [Ferruginibacter sp.]
MKNSRVFIIAMMLITGYDAAAQKTKTVAKPAAADTVVIEPEKDSILIPFEPHESRYQQALKAAKGSKERTGIFKQYNDALFASSLTTDQKKVLLRQKIEQYIQTDFYSLYEYFLQVSKENNKAMMFISVFKSTATELQWKALTEYMKYTVEAAQLSVYNQTTGQTEQLKRPTNWPAGLPYPGYGWGKYLSTDDVATPVSMQYHLPEAERYRIISQYKKEGKKISPDDQAWYTVYELNAAKQRTTAAASQGKIAGADLPDETRLKNLVGKYYYYASASQLECTTCKVVSYTSKDEIRLTCQYGNTKKATLDELVNNKAIFGYHPAQAVLRQCKACNGNGVVKSSFSHTNDYQYTLGKKITYTSTIISNCMKCGGSGYFDERF